MLPVSAKAFVPGLFSVRWIYTSQLRFDNKGTLAKVSTLFKTVGISNKPCSTVLGGFTWACHVSFNRCRKRASLTANKRTCAPIYMNIEAKIASSMFSPSKPNSFACSMAF